MKAGVLEHPISTWGLDLCLDKCLDVQIFKWGDPGFIHRYRNKENLTNQRPVAFNLLFSSETRSRGLNCKHPITSVVRIILSKAKTAVATDFPLVWGQEILRRHLGADPRLASLTEFIWIILTMETILNLTTNFKINNN